MNQYTTFLGLDNIPRNKAIITILPVPYDSTTSYRSGTREGPHAIIKASEQVELYDHRNNYSLESSFFHLLPPLLPSLSRPKQIIDMVERRIKPDVRSGRIPFILGGEHSITSGAVSSCAKVHSGLTVVQIDAHADLRNDWNGTPWSHACVMRRILENPNVSRIIQVGIRNASEECMTTIQENGHTVFWAHSRPENWVEKISSIIGDDPTYLTIDLDGLDPSIMPSVGTPEPGGLNWTEMEHLARKSACWNLVGLDIVELMPIPGLHAPDFLAAKLMYLLVSGIVKRLR